MTAGDGPGEPFGSLAGELEARFALGVDEILPDADFQDLALRVFRHQFETNAVYRRFCEGRGATPGTVERWEAVPAVPTDAFKHLPLVSGPPEAVERVFRTSGTTGGRGRRGEHRVRRLALYHAALLPNFRAHLLPDGEKLPFLSLVPSPARAPDSSLSEMVGVAAAELARGEAAWFTDPESGIDEAGLAGALREAETAKHPVLVATTAFALVHWLDATEREGWRFRLPDGSRMMETGGFKGRSRAVERDALYAAAEAGLGIPTGRIVNEYGMTELLSQFYEPVLRRDGGRRHVPPPWVRTRVVDPATLERLPAGRPGILIHVDLANLGSVAAVLTADRGVEEGDGFRVLGRVAGAEPRGCSLAMDELLSARG